MHHQPTQACSLSMTPAASLLSRQPPRPAKGLFSATLAYLCRAIKAHIRLSLFCLRAAQPHACRPLVRIALCRGALSARRWSTLEQAAPKVRGSAGLGDNALASTLHMHSSGCTACSASGLAHKPRATCQLWVVCPTACGVPALPRAASEHASVVAERLLYRWGAGCTAGGGCEDAASVRSAQGAEYSVEATAPPRLLAKPLQPPPACSS